VDNSNKLGNAICYLFSGVVVLLLVLSIGFWLYPFFKNTNENINGQFVFESTVDSPFQTYTVGEGRIRAGNEQNGDVRDIDVEAVAYPSIKRPDSISPVEWRSLERAAKAASADGEQLLNRLVNRVLYYKQEKKLKLLGKGSDKDLRYSAMNELVSNIR